ncbi:MAG TPA: hypothetical protein VHE80_06175 [Acidimicrobiales bacterium]|nr:hypothetical protein [Acidimicrobiales bacterium]
MLIAYIDSNSGSLVAQVAVAGLAGAGVAVKLTWRRVAERLSRNRGAMAAEVETGTETQPS